MRVDDFSEETLAIVNELLPGASPIGAYTMGAVTTLALECGMIPDRQLLHYASKAVTLYAIEPIFDAWRLAHLRKMQKAGVR